MNLKMPWLDQKGSQGAYQRKSTGPGEPGVTMGVPSDPWRLCAGGRRVGHSDSQEDLWLWTAEGWRAWSPDPRLREPVASVRVEKESEDMERLFGGRGGRRPG